MLALQVLFTSAMMNHEHLLYLEVENYVAGALGTEQRRSVYAHAADCSECRDRIIAEALHRSVRKRVARLLFEEEPALRPCAV